MITIAWDIDDVLNDLMHEWFTSKWAVDHSACNIDYNELIFNPPNGPLGISLEEYLASLDEFRMSEKYLLMRPVNEVKSWFLAHGEKYRHVAITATPYKTANKASFWLFENYGKWIRTFHYVPSMRPDEIIPVYDSNKKEALEIFSNIDVFIDDNKNNFYGLDDSQVKTILFPRPWNENPLTITETLAGLTKYLYSIEK